MNTKIRVGGAVLVGFTLVGGALFSRYHTQGIPDASATIIVATPKEYLIATDTDKDGIEDWEEALVGSDPKKPNERVVPTQTPDAFAEEDNTITARFGKRFFGEFIQKSSGDAEMSDQEKQALINTSLAEVIDIVKDTPFTRKDLLISKKSDSEALHQYGNLLVEALNHNTNGGDNELLIFKRAIDANSEEEIALLDPIITAYKGMITDVRAVPVPEILASDHLALLNTLLSVHNSLTLMRNALIDPLPALARSQTYFETLEQMKNNMLALHFQFEKAGVTFDKSEPGILFELMTKI